MVRDRQPGLTPGRQTLGIYGFFRRFAPRKPMPEYTITLSGDDEPSWGGMCGFAGHFR